MNNVRRPQADCSSLIIRAIRGCSDPTLTSDTPQEWAKDLIPCLFDPSQTSDITQTLVSAPFYSEVTIGRAPSCWLKLKDPSISGRHCRLCLVRTVVKANQEGRSASSNISCYVVDQSTNGTFIDQTRIPRDTPTLLHPGQIVSLGRGRLAGSSGCSSGTLEEDSSHVFAFTVSISSSSHSGFIELDEGNPNVNCQDVPVDSPDIAYNCDNQRLRDQQHQQLHGAVPTSRPHCTQAVWQCDDDPQQRPGSRSRRIEGADDPSTSDHGESMVHSSLRFVTPPPSSRRPPVRHGSAVQQQQSFDSQARCGGGGTPSNQRLTELVKRLQREGTKKDEEIADMVGELERSELQRQELALKLKEATEEIHNLQRRLNLNADHETALERELSRAEQTVQQLRGEIKDAERWERKAQELHAQTTVLNRRLENVQALLRDAEAARNETLANFDETKAQLEEVEIRRDQAIGLLKASREEAERLRAEVTALKKSEQELSERNRILERRLAASENLWKDAQNSADKQFSDLEEKALKYLAEAESCARLIEAQKMISLHVNGLLRNAFALTAKAANPDALRDIMARGAESELLDETCDIDEKSPDIHFFPNEDTTGKEDDAHKRSSRAMDSRNGFEESAILCEPTQTAETQLPQLLSNLPHKLTDSPLTPAFVHSEPDGFAKVVAFMFHNSQSSISHKRSSITAELNVCVSSQKKRRILSSISTTTSNALQTTSKQLDALDSKTPSLSKHSTDVDDEDSVSLQEDRCIPLTKPS